MFGSRPSIETLETGRLCEDKGGEVSRGKSDGKERHPGTVGVIGRRPHWTILRKDRIKLDNKGKGEDRNMIQGS